MVDRIARAALSLMLAQRGRRPLPDLPATAPVPADLARRIEGRYRAGDKTAVLEERDGRLFLRRSGDDLRHELRTAGDALVTDDALGYGLTVLPAGERLTIGADTFVRQPDVRPQPAPSRFGGLIGEYGWDHDTLFVYEDEGQLWALIEWYTAYPLKEESETVFRFPDRGLYDGESLVFKRDAQGRATEVVAAEVRFVRRITGPAAGGTFRIAPQEPVERLRARALAARPPDERGEFRKADLVELTRLDPTIRLDVRYAGTENFLGTPIYRQARAFLQRPAAEALVRAHRNLARLGYGLLIHDAYRPWYVTRIFWDATPPDKRMFVADPSQGSRHNRGSAVDLTLFSLATGKPVEMPGVYDEMSERSYPGYVGGTALQRWHRERLRDAMEAEGFTVYEVEWWHFDHRDWRQYPLLNLPFEGL